MPTMKAVPAMTSVLASTAVIRRGTTVSVVVIMRVPYSAPICMTAREAIRNWAMTIPAEGTSRGP